MNFFIGIFFFFFTLYIVFRIFGRQIIQFVLKQILRRVVKDAENQTRQYRQNYESTPFEESIFVSDELKVNSPKHKQKKAITADEIAEDIDFEDVSDS